jgi:thiol:disulfide interchange protein DsbA
MNALRRLACMLVLLGCAAGAGATPADPQAGTDYLVLPEPQPTDSGKQVEVLEFFAYYCPHCYGFEPVLAAWVKKQGAAIRFTRVHVPRDASVLPQQRLFYTLQALGLEEQYHNQVFEAMHREHDRLGTDQAVFDWAAAHGIDRTRFINAYTQLGVQARVRHANNMVEAYHIPYWPVLVVDGKYLTSPSQVGEQFKTATEAQEQQMVLPVLDHLVAKARAGKQ